MDLRPLLVIPLLLLAGCFGAGVWPGTGKLTIQNGGDLAAGTRTTNELLLQKAAKVQVDVTVSAGSVSVHVLEASEEDAFRKGRPYQEVKEGHMATSTKDTRTIGLVPGEYAVGIVCTSQARCRYSLEIVAEM